MKDFIFDDGFTRYKVNGDENRVVKFNPMDEYLFDDLLAFEQKFDKEVKAKNFKDKKERQEFDVFLRTELNKIFGYDVSTPAFGKACLTIDIASNGQHVFANFIRAMLDVFKPLQEERIRKAEEEQKKYLAKTQKYTKHYNPRYNRNRKGKTIGELKSQ